MRAGTPYHRSRFCNAFIETHRVYDPKQLGWPEMDPAAVAFLRSIPFFGAIIGVEERAAEMVEAYARTIGDPLIRRAVELQAGRRAQTR